MKIFYTINPKMQGRKVSIISMETPNGTVSRGKGNTLAKLYAEVAFSSPKEIALGDRGMTFVIRTLSSDDKGEFTLKKITSLEVPSELREEDFVRAVEAIRTLE